MIAVDTNLLVYAHRGESPWHQKAGETLRSLAEGPGPWAIPWPCVHEFLAIVTHPRIFDPPTPVPKARAQVESWLASPSLQLLSESGSYWTVLGSLLQKGKVAGAQVHDARIAALCQHHGIRELWSADRDFGRFPKLRVRNPLVEQL